MKTLHNISPAILTLALLFLQPHTSRAILPEFSTITGQVNTTEDESIPYPSVIAVANGDTLGAYMSDGQGRFRIDLTFPTISSITTVEEKSPEALSIELHQNYPNPFNPSTTISFELAEPGNVRLAVYSISGQKVATLIDGQASAGIHRVVWDGNDESGRQVGSGIYLYRLVADGTFSTRKMLLLDGGMAHSGGTPVAAYRGESSSTVAKPAAITCDIIASKPGYETVVLSGIVIPDGQTALPEPIVMTREESTETGPPIPLEVGTVWEFVESIDDFASPDSIVTYSTQIIGTKNMLYGLTFYEFDNWPIFIPEVFQDSVNPPLIQITPNDGDIYFLYNECGLLLFPSSPEKDQHVNIELPSGNMLSYYAYKDDSDHYHFSNDEHFSISMIYGSVPDPDYDIYLHGVFEEDTATGEFLTETEYTYCVDQHGVLFYIRIDDRISGAHRNIYLKRMINENVQLGLSPDITPVDGIQDSDITFLLNYVVEKYRYSTGGIGPLWLAKWAYSLKENDLTNDDVIPESPYLRFHVTTYEEIQSLAEEFHEITGFHQLAYTQNADTLAVEFGCLSYVPAGSPFWSGGGWGIHYRFYPYDDFWYGRDSGGYIIN